MPAWLAAMLGAQGVLLAVLAVAVVALWRICTGALYETARRLDDQETILGALRDDVGGLIDAVGDLEGAVDEIKANPLGPPAEEASAE